MTPQFFYISDITNSSSFNGKMFRKKSMLENFPAYVLKMGYFHCLRVKNSNHLHTELSFGYLEDAKFYLESKASFIDISSIASFKLFLVALSREYCTFSDSGQLEVLALAKIYPVENYFPKKSCSIVMFHYQTVFLL